MNAVYRDFILLFPVKLLGFKRIFHFHAGGLASIYESVPYWAKPIYRYVYFKADYSICLSKAGSIDPSFLQSKKIDIIPSGVEAFANQDAVHNDVQTTINKTDTIMDKPFVVLFTGLCSASKGILDFIEVVRICNDQDPRIVGKVLGKAYSAIEEKALNDASAEGLVQFEGVLTGNKKEMAFLSANAFLFPSVFESENCPTVIIEAFAAGLPVVATQWRGITDLVNHGKNGFIHKPHDTKAMAISILQLAQNNELYRQLSAQAKSDFETNYTMGIFEASIVAYFKKI
jgi:glycosyltransferase involved in cell wall biosynthesis